MAEPFVAEIRIFPFNFAPSGWALCNGQVLAISQNTALFSILGTTYGGNGTTDFALPNLQGSTPMGYGQGARLTPRELGEIGGSTAVTLLVSQIPAHTHKATCNSAMGDQYAPPGNFWATDAGGNNEDAASTDTQMAPSAVGATGSNSPHNNIQPYLALNFCIALQGVFPPHS